MPPPVTLAAAGNTLAPALAALRSLGYTVTSVPGLSGDLKAEAAGLCFVGEDPLQLLGLVRMHELRGAHWQANDDERAAWHKLEGRGGA